MVKETDGNVVIEKEDFEDVVKRFKSKPTKSYDFLVKSGIKM